MGQKAVEFAKAFSFGSSIDYSNKSIVSKKIISSKGGNISLFAFDKGEELSEHTAPFDALVQILHGKAEIKIDGAINEVIKGQSIIMPANIPHALRAVESFKMLLTMLKTE